MKYFLNYILLLGFISLLGCKKNANKGTWFLTNNSNNLEQAEPLAPGIISSSKIEYGGNISDKYKEIYFTVNDTSWKSSYAAVSKFKNNKLISRDTVRFAGKTMQGGDAHLSPDGDRLFIASRLSKDTTVNDGNIWVATRNKKGWSKAEKLPSTINTALGEYSPSQASSGNIYFTRFTEETHGDIYVSKFINGKYQEAIRLPESVNSKFIECDSWVSPDESFILFVRRTEDGFNDGYGFFDVYISFNENGNWSEAQNLGKDYNTKFTEGSPSITPDSKYILYTSNRKSKDPKKFDGSLDIYIQEFELEKIKSKSIIN
ncbi:MULTISPECIES: TolB family protein [Flavobacteriaceae]|uniref:TolB family protein n=1 Tax=Flavobacteriaceae TaxID=49546 RepID=UPI0014912AAD|nr:MULTISPECIES: PD40 domain-containing protein [Allomuricauda]MDC6364876.1 PD40 domain-containing protein [Muricauda sp. AC10]